jgi:hypothetical protein
MEVMVPRIEVALAERVVAAGLDADDLRFLSKIEVDENGCWLVTDAPLPNGYVSLSVGGRSGTKVLVHRYAYEAFIGPIPEGHVVDHECHTDACSGGVGCLHRRCVNPAHLVAKTQRSNVLRSNTIVRANAAKTHCKRGRPLRGDNLYVFPNGKRLCKTCRLARQRERDAQMQAGALPAPSIVPATCRAGHPLDDATLAVGSGRWWCRACKRASTANHRSARKDREYAG